MSAVPTTTTTGRPAKAKDAAPVDSVPTVEVSANSSIRSKLRQCLAVLQVPLAPAPAPELEPDSKPAEKAARRKTNKIVALKAVCPSAGSKTITIAEIAKRCIAASASSREGGEKAVGGIWWQYTKIEGKLVEWPQRKEKKQHRQQQKRSKEAKTTEGSSHREEGDRGVKPEANPKVLLNASKRRKSSMDERTAKKQKIDHQPSHSDQNPSSEVEASPTPVPRVNSSPDPESDDRPPHLRDTSPAAPSESSSIPPHLRDSPQATHRSSSKPPHLYNPTSDDRPPHLRSSSPGVRSDSPRQPSSPETPRPLKAPSAAKAHAVTSSPPFVTDDDMELDDAEAAKPAVDAAPGPEPDEDEDEDEDGDDYHDFKQLDIEQMPEKYAKKLLADLDEAESKRTKYRAIAVMTIYLSLERRADLEKLYGVQTNKVKE